MNTHINNRELSWLSFNERVLLEAIDTANPLLERIRFVAIHSSNMDEFFMVRVSGLHEQVRAGYSMQDFSGLTPEQQLKNIAYCALRFNKLQQQIFNQMKDELANEGIRFPAANGNEFDKELRDIFLDEILPVISPVTISPSRPFPFIYSRRICMIIELCRRGKSYISLIMIPEILQRVVRICKDNMINIFTVEDIIKAYLPLLFNGYEVKNSGYFRVTRDADLDVTAEESADLLKIVENSLSQRKRGNINRLEVSSDTSEESLTFIKTMLSISDDAITVVDGPIDLTFLFSLTDMKESLMFPPFSPRLPMQITTNENVFDRIKHKSVYFFRPYDSFNFVSDLIEQAATDEDVLAIKMTLYRTNENSGIIASLLKAAKRGKQVSVVVELKARFDEEKNIEWARNLEKAGCIVTYGIVGLKIHAKSMLIIRREQGKIVRYTHIATGNYNEITANMYTDIDIITADEVIGKDVTQLFNYLMGFTEEKYWGRMVVAPFMLRNEVISMIDYEIAIARTGHEGRITMKLNSLIDEQIINKLYEASAAGVEIDLIVRGICGLKPHIKGISDNIRVRSIVGRFLEHARILYFRHGGDDKYYITSADMMQRNLNGRVELMINVIDDDFKASLGNYLSVQLADNCKAWELHGDKYMKLVPMEGKERFCAQEYFLAYKI